MFFLHLHRMFKYEQEFHYRNSKTLHKIIFFSGTCDSFMQLAMLPVRGPFHWFPFPARNSMSDLDISHFSLSNNLCNQETSSE